MIEYITGRLTELTPATATIETAGGVAYLLNISLNTFSSLEARSKDAASVKLYVHESIREDAWVLYGFAGQEERALFRLLIGVSGVGAATTRVILSSHTVAELETIISTGDTKRLKQVKGVGAKTADRIIVDLRDKIKPSDSTLLNVGLPVAQANKDVYDEALVALVTLGFSRAASQKALDKIFTSEADIKVETAIKRALALL